MEEFKQKPEGDQIINAGEGILIRKKILYHGSSISTLEKLKPAEETTIGEGIYFTVKLEDAKGYAIRRSRSRKGSQSTVYQAEIENLKLIDLRNNNTVKSILTGFLEILKKEVKVEGTPWYYESTLYKIISKIESNKISAGNLREVTFNVGSLFTEYIQSLNYDGLIANEGGEGNEVGEHETYLIFDPEKIKHLSILK